MTFQEQIEEYISTKREGNWDFKVEPHDSNASLLHDIICLANNIHDGDSYLIIGVDNSGEVIGLNQKHLKRKNQAQIIDFLRKMSFAGQYRPEISLVTLIIKEKEIDVLTVYNKPYKPYFLIEEYSAKSDGKKVRPFHIYSRIGDTNTPIDKSADIFHLEKMWEERFGLNLPPNQRYIELLKGSNNWEFDIGNSRVIFHKNFPEFKIKMGEFKEQKKTFSFFFDNESSFEGSLKFRFFSTTLFKWKYIYVDEMNIYLPQPEIGSVLLEEKKRYFYYFDISNLQGAFLVFLKNQNVNKHYWLVENFEPFLIFQDQNKIQEFKEKLISRYHSLKKIKCDISNIQRLQLEHGFESFTNDPVFLKQVYEFWKSDFFPKLKW